MYCYSFSLILSIKSCWQNKFVIKIFAFWIFEFLLRTFGTSKPSPKLPYGLNPIYKTVVAEEKVAAPITPISDRIANAKAMVLAFAAEHSLLFALVPKVIELTKALAKAQKALESLTMNRTTASYLTRYEVGKTFEHYVTEMMKCTKFSFKNFIECWQFLFAFIVLWWGKLKFVTLDHSPALKLTV